MNKLLTKAAKLVLGLSLAAGVGVAISSQSKASRVDATDVPDTLVASSFQATNTTYTNFSGVTFSSDAVYAGNNGKTSSGGIQLRSKNSNSGIVTTASGGTLKSISITVESGSNTLDVYGKNTAYSSASDLYDSSKQGTKIGSRSTTGSISLSNPGNYSYVGLRSNNGALYLTNIVITWDDGAGGTTYSVTYDANATVNVGGTLPSAHTGLADNATQSLSATGPTRWGYTFSGWATSPSSTSSVSSVTINGDDITVYAIWTADLTITGAHASVPFTVAQARTHIDGGSNLDENYVAGKISQIDSYNSTYKSLQYWISDDGTTTNQLEVYSGKGLNSADFSSTSDIQIGADVVVCGTLKKYNSTYEFDKNNYQVSYSYTPPAVTHDVTFVANGGSNSPAAQTVGDGQTFIFPSAGTKANNIFKGWSSNNSTFYQEGDTSGAISADTTFTAYWQTEGTSADPYSVAEAKAAIDANTGLVGAHVSGLVSQVSASINNDNTITYYISDDGTTNGHLEVYKGKNLNNTDFSDISDVEVGASVTVVGRLKLYNNTKYEFDSGNYLISYSAPVVVTYDVTYSAGSNGSGSYVHADQTEGTYSLLPFASLTGVSASSGYRFKSYTLNGVERAPGYEFTLDDDITITVNFEVKPSGTEVSTTIADYAATNNWVNSTTQYFTINLDPVTLTAAGGGNTGKYYSSDESWRLYSSSNDTLTISVPSGCSLVSTTITFSGTITFGGNAITSGNEISLSGTSAVFSVTANVKITEISVVYSGSVTTYTITYDSNGGSGSMTATTGTNPVVAACTFTAPSGLEFSRWNDESNGTGNDYAVGQTVNANVTLYAIWEAPAIDPSEYFTKITSTADISDGKYVIAYGDLIFDGSLTTLDAVSNTLDLTLSNFLTGYFTISDGKVRSASGYYIGQTSDANGLLSNTSTEYTNTISFDGDGNVNIVGSGGAHLRYNSASNQERFRYYKSSSYSSQNAIQLYKINFAKVMLGEITCNAQGTSEPSGSWSALENYYNTLSSTEKTSFVQAVANESGTDLQKAMAKYDYIVGKYNPTNSGSSAFKNFIGRSVTPIGGQKLLLSTVMGKNTNTVAIIVIISLISVTAIGGFFFIRKRKVN